MIGSMVVSACCHFCQGSVVETGYACGDRPSLTIGCCADCDLVQVSDFDHATIDYYAADNYFPVDSAPIYAREAHWNVTRIEKCLEYLPDPTARRILDFGCGIGGFLKRAKPHFAKVVGFDLSRRLVDAHRADGHECVGDLTEVPGNIDTSVLFHVLEHVPQPWLLIAELVSRFPSVDRVVVEVPHNREALLSYFDSTPYRLNHYSADHLYYFTNVTLSAVLQRAGLQVLVNSQVQRYALGNTFGWLTEGRGGGQNKWTAFNEKQFHDSYSAALTEAGVADSVFMVATPWKNG
jgi:SAM-dependent methyltransferase